MKIDKTLQFKFVNFDLQEVAKQNAIGIVIETEIPEFYSKSSIENWQEL